jgi:RNA polymerase sigma-70 factor (ECF subfamily)
MMRIFRARSREARAQAFDRLVRPHVAVLYRSALRFARSSADAEDLVQSVLIKAYGRLAELEQIVDLRPWLLRVLYREFVDARRRTTRRARWEDAACRDSEGVDELAPAAEEPATFLEHQRLSNELNIALRSLEPEQRALVMLHYVDGYSVEALTAVFNAPVGTLKARIHRIRAKLRDLIAMQPFGDGERV